MSGTGELPREPASSTQSAHRGIALHDELRTSALQDNAALWNQTWQALDGGPLRKLLERTGKGTGTDDSVLTLCGEHAAQTYDLQDRNLWSRVARSFTRPDLHSVLKNL